MEGYKYVQDGKGYYVPQVNEAMISNQVGLVQRCTRQLLKNLSKLSADRRITINVSFMQLYNEKIYDLLN